MAELKAPVPSSRPAATPKSFCMAGDAGARACFPACAACSLSRFGMRRNRRWSWCATVSARSRCITRRCRMDRLVFGSEIKSLLKVQDLDRRLDPEAVEDFFTYGYVPDPKTIYAAIRKLPAAHALIARRGQPFELLRYWNLLDDFPVTASRHGCQGGDGGVPAPFREAPADFRCRSGRAVVGRRGFQRRGLADGAASGVASISTFSIGFKERDYDESALCRGGFARAITRAITPASWIRTISACCRACRPSMTSRSATSRRFPPSRSASWRGSRSRRRSPAMAATRFWRVIAAMPSSPPRCGRGAASADALRRPLFSLLADIYPHGASLPRSCAPRPPSGNCRLTPADAYLRMVSALPREIRAPISVRGFSRQPRRL